MKSSDGRYFEKLDHVRALAAFLVFHWHFTSGSRMAFTEEAKVPLASFLAQGHVGVALFLTLSGYLFAKLLDGSQILYGRFLLNRIIRLFPLLLVALFLSAIQAYRHELLGPVFLKNLLSGIVIPTWPNGAWSIAVELHFYIILPLLLWLMRFDVRWLIGIVVAAVVLRAGIFITTGVSERLAYWTIVGRIDQFVLGMYFWALSGRLKNNHMVATSCLVTLYILYALAAENISSILPPKNAQTAYWIVIPTIEALLIAPMIAYYDRSDFRFSTSVSRALASIGTWSFSIYLLHFFYYGSAVRFINQYIFPLSDYLPNLIFSIIAFAAFLPVAWLSFRYIETPFLRYRMPYIAGRAAPVSSSVQQPA